MTDAAAEPNANSPLLNQKRASHPRPEEQRPWASYIPCSSVILTIIVLWGSYLYCELIPEVKHNKATGIAEIIIFHFILTCFLVNYFMTMFKSPGEIPENDPEWKVAYNSKGQLLAEAASAEHHEMKSDGDRRRCKWCIRYKPDRCHHCRICKKCVLRMDHHCPWVNNCVGWANHKNFVLTAFYAAACCVIIFSTCLARLCEKDRRESLNDKVEFGFMIFCAVAAAGLFLPTAALYGFHIWLGWKGMSTIEFCEKRSFGARYRSRYYHGPLKNLQQILGENVLTWFCCFGYPKGDGMHFQTAQSRVKVDLSYSKPTTTNRFSDKLGPGSSAVGSSSKDPELDRGSVRSDTEEVSVS